MQAKTKRFSEFGLFTEKQLNKNIKDQSDLQIWRIRWFIITVESEIVAANQIVLKRNSKWKDRDPEHRGIVVHEKYCSY